MVTRCSPKSQFQLPCALPVDVEQDVPTLAQRLLHGRLRGAVSMAEDVRPFDELVGRRSAVEFRIVDEMIVHPVDLARPLGPVVAEIDIVTSLSAASNIREIVDFAGARG